MAKGRIVLMKPDLTPVTVEQNLLYFECSRQENQVGSFSCALPMRTEYEQIGVDWALELQRSFDNGSTWINDTSTLWFVRSHAIEVAATTETVLMTGHDGIGLLDRRIVAYFSVENPENGMDYYSVKNQPADDAMREVVRENYTSDILLVPTADLPGSVYSATVDNRAYRIMGNVVVEANKTKAQTVQAEIAWATVNEALRNLAELAIENGERIIYDLVYDSALRQFVFTVWVGLRGQDMSKKMLFSTTAGNIAELRMIKDYSAEATYLHVGGDGQAKKKIIAASKSATAFQRTPWYPIEAFLDAPDSKNSQELMEKKGQREINKRAARWVFSAKSVDREGTLFGKDYHYGDLVTIQHRGQSSACRIKSFRIRYENGREAELEVPLESEEII